MPNEMNEVVATGRADFEGHPLDVYEVDGVRWVRGSQLENPLGFGAQGVGQIDTPLSGKPWRDSNVRKVFERHKAEFDPAMTRTLPLRTAGGVQDARCFSPDGCYLLAMLAQTPAGARFRRFVLDLIAGRARILPLAADGRPLPSAAPDEGKRFTVGAEAKLALKELLDVADDPAAVRRLVQQLLDGQRAVRLDASAEMLVRAYDRVEIMRQMVNRAASELAQQCRRAGYSFTDIKYLWRRQGPLAPDYARRLRSDA